MEVHRAAAYPMFDPTSVADSDSMPPGSKRLPIEHPQPSRPSVTSTRKVPDSATRIGQAFRRRCESYEHWVIPSDQEGICYLFRRSRDLRGPSIWQSRVRRPSAVRITCEVPRCTLQRATGLHRVLHIQQHITQRFAVVARFLPKPTLLSFDQLLAHLLQRIGVATLHEGAIVGV